MSDIYLQITETPTVVTLSAPVVSGALASTVTVANTVTVALDSNSLSALENVTVTVGAAITGTVTVSNFPSSQAVTFSAVSISNLPSTQTIAGTVTANAFGKSVIGSTNFPIPIIGYDEDIISADLQITVPVQISSLNGSVGSSNPLPISGTVTANVAGQYFDIASGDTAQLTNPVYYDGEVFRVSPSRPLPVALATGYNYGASVTIGNSLTIGSALPAGTNRIGVVTIGGGTVTIGAGTSQIGSVTASISGTVPVSGTFWQATQPASLASLPALAAGTAQIGSVTASISNSVVTIYPMQGTSVSNTNFTSVTASTTLVSAVANREVLTVFNESGTLFISPGATCTTVAYQVRLSAGDYWECPQGQQSLQHTAVYLTTGGTARVCQVS